MRAKELLKEYGFPSTVNAVNTVPNFYTDPPKELGDDLSKINDLGQGAFSSAWQNKDQPQDITKGTKRFSSGYAIDGFYMYARTLQQTEELRDNPYFPHFRQLNLFHDENGNVSYSAQMETLHSIRQLKKKEIAQILRTIAGDMYAELIKSIRLTTTGRWELERLEQYPAHYLVRLITDLTGADKEYSTFRKYVSDDSLLQAVDFIRSLRNKYGVDIHDENIMIRRSQYGNQLVITDPLSFSSGYSPLDDKQEK